MGNNINLSESALRAIFNLQHKNGTYRYYAETISRLMTFILHQGDEIGMSDSEALSTLRALHCLREDLGDIAGPVASSLPMEVEGDSPEEVAERVEALFGMEIAAPDGVGSPDEEDLPRDEGDNDEGKKLL